MKMFFVANDKLASSMKKSLERYFPQNDVVTIDFPRQEFQAGTRKLASALFQMLTENPDETFLFIADRYGSTAFNETRLLLARSELSKRALILTDLQLPLAIKYYGMLDSVSLNQLRALQDEEPSLLAG